MTEGRWGRRATRRRVRLVDVELATEVADVDTEGVLGDGLDAPVELAA